MSLIYGLIVGICWDLPRAATKWPGWWRSSPRRGDPGLGRGRLGGLGPLGQSSWSRPEWSGDANETFEFLFLDKPPLKFANWTLGKFGAALFQQLALQLFLWPACLEMTRSRISGAVLASALFGLIHLPSPTLVVITTLAGFIWILFYRRSGRIAPLVFTHMILATLAHGSLPERLTYDMRVGQAATDDMKRFEDLNDPHNRLINRRLKHNRASLKHFTTAEYYESQGGNLPDLVRGLFRDILGRPATESDVAFWTNRATSRTAQADIVNVLLASDEYAEIEEARRASLDRRVLRR